jgi:hypothetical protein
MGRSIYTLRHLISDKYLLNLALLFYIINLFCGYGPSIIEPVQIMANIHIVVALSIEQTFDQIYIGNLDFKRFN